jgi:serine/threonine protein kinase
VKQITDDFFTVLGKFSNGLNVTVKMLNITISKRCEEQFMVKIGIAGHTRHKNLMKLYDFCFDESTKAFLYEYMENGSSTSIY